MLRNAAALYEPVVKSLYLTQQRSMFLARSKYIFRDEGLDGVDRGDDGEDEGGPVDDGVLLGHCDTIKSPGDNKWASEVAFAKFDVSDGSGLEEKQADDDSDLDEETWAFIGNFGSEGSERVDDSNHSDPSVVQGERGVDPEGVVNTIGRVLVTDGVIDIWDLGDSDEDGDEWEDKMVGLPEREPQSVQQGDSNKVPLDTVNNGFGGRFEELIDNETGKQKVNGTPDTEHGSSRGDVGGMCILIWRVILFRTSDRVNVGAQKEEVRQQVGEFDDEREASHGV